MVSRDKKTNFKVIQEMLRKRMKARGYDDLMSFIRASGLGEVMAFETLRRTFNDPSKPSSALSVGIVMQRLGFTNNEIIETMKELGDEYVYTLISPDSQSTELWLEGVSAAAQKLAEAGPENVAHIAAALRLVASMAGVDISPELAKVVPPPRTRKKATQKIEKGESQGAAVEGEAQEKVKPRKVFLD